MVQMVSARRLVPPVDVVRDHILGPADAPITLVEYGSYACPHCRAANEALANLRDRFGERMRYVVPAPAADRQRLGAAFGGAGGARAARSVLEYSHVS